MVCILSLYCHYFVLNYIFSLINRGVLPFIQRRKIWDKYRAKARKQKTNNLSSDIIVGSQVCMKNSPLYQPGAIGMLKTYKKPKIM